MDRSHFRNRFLLPTFLFAFSLFLCEGCSTRSATLTLKPSRGETAYAQQFDQSFAGRLDDGAWSVVMVSQDKSADALRQIVHLKIHWRPMGNTRSICANAAIDWYITSAGSDDLLLYQGAGHVAIEPGEKITKVDIRSATMRPSANRGQLADSLGEAKLSGAFVAQTDRQTVQKLLEEARTHAATVAAAAE